MELSVKAQKAEENFTDNRGHNILRFFKVSPFFHITNEKMLVISNENGIYDLSLKLANVLILLRELENFRKA